MRSRKELDLEEERRYLEHVKAEMHLHATYARAAELSKQRDLLAAWEREGHLKNLTKLKSLGPSAMREYARDVLAGTPGTVAPGSSSARLATPDVTQSGMSSSRASARGASLPRALGRSGLLTCFLNIQETPKAAFQIYG